MTTDYDHIMTRIANLELDRNAHGKRIDNAFYCCDRLEELIADKAKRVENWADIIEAHGGAIDAHTERLHIHDTDLVAWEHATDSLQRMHENMAARLSQLEQDCLIVSNQHVDRMGALETQLGELAQRITAYIQTNTEIAHTVLGLIGTLANRITELETADE